VSTGTSGPRACAAFPAFPDASCTGVPAGTKLTPSGRLTVTTPNTVLDALDITGDVLIQASGVKITRSRIHGNAFFGVRVVSGDVTISDSELFGFSEAAMTYSNWTAIRVNIHDVGSDGVKFGTNTLLADSWLHDFAPTEGAHADGGQLQAGERNIVVRHNRIDARSRSGSTPGNAALFIAPDLGPSSDGPLLIEQNHLDGGNYTLYCVDGGDGKYFLGHITIRDNRFGRNAQYGPLRINVPATVSGNAFADNGQPVT